MLFPNWFEIGLEIAKQSLPIVVLLASVVYVWQLERSKRAKLRSPVRRGSRMGLRNERAATGRPRWAVEWSAPLSVDSVMLRF